MADSPLKWVFELFDRMSGPAKAIAEALREEAAALKESGAATDELGEKQERAGKHAESFTSRFHDARENLEDFAEKGLRVVEVLADLGKEMIGAAAEAERVDISFGLLFGEKAGGALLDNLDQLRGFLDIADNSMKSFASRLGTAGFAAKEIPKALAAAADIGAILGGPQHADSAIGALERLQLSGEINKRVLMGLGVAPDEFGRRLGVMLGKGANEAMKAAEAGGVGREQLIEAVYQTIEAKTHGVIGTAGLEAGRSVGALLSRVKELPEQYFEELRNGKGFSIFRGFLENVAGLLSPRSDFGREISQQLDEIFGGTMRVIFGDISGPNGAQLMQQRIRGILDTTQEWINKFDSDSISRGFDAIGQAASVLLDTLKLVASAVESIGTFSDKIAGTKQEIYDSETGTTSRHQLGDKQTVEFSDDDKANLLYRANLPVLQRLFASDETLDRAAFNQWMKETGIGGGEKLSEGANQSLEINSPSRVFARMGRQSADGFAVGVGEGSATVGEAVGDSFTGAPGFSSDRRRGSASSGGLSVGKIEISMPIDASGFKGDPAELGARLHEMLPGVVAALVERLAAEQGA